MRPHYLLSGLLLLASSISLSSAMARGGAPAAPHMAAAPHFAAAPRMAAPMRMPAPRMAAPMRMPVARMAAPMRMPQARAPQMHMAAPHMAAPHMAEHFHMAAPQHMSEPHINEGARRQEMQAHMPQAHMPQGHEPEARMAAEHGMPQHGMPEHGMPQHGMPEHGQDAHMQQARMPQEHMDQRGQEFGKGANPRVEEARAKNDQLRLNGMHPNGAPHMMQENPKASSEVKLEHEMAMEHLQPGQNKRLITPGRLAAGAVGGAAIAGLAAHQMHQNQMHENQPHENQINQNNGEQGHEQPNHPGQAEQFSGHGGKNTHGIANVPPTPGYANPRRFEEGRGGESAIRKEPAGRLAYRQGVEYYPRGGDKHKGIPGVYDPGGYLRTPREAGTRISQDFARKEIERMPNWQRHMEDNRRNMISDRSQWPWHLPQQRTWWNPTTWGGSSYGQVANTAASPYAANPYGGNPDGYNPPLNLPGAYGGNPYGYGGYGSPYAGNPYAALSPFYGYDGGGTPNYWNNFNNYDGWNNWNNQYANVDPGYYGGGFGSSILGALGGLFGSPQGVGIGSGGPSDWMQNLLYAQNYSINGATYPANYFAMNGYVPTPYVFNVADGQFWQPGTGYSDALPSSYQAPITVASQEVVPQFDANGNIVGYQPETFYNDAYYDNDAGAYGYYDYRKRFHWAKLPGLIARVEQHI